MTGSPCLPVHRLATAVLVHRRRATILYRDGVTHQSVREGAALTITEGSPLPTAADLG
jgi:hypothetical protein